MNSRAKNLLFWVVVGLFMILLFNLFSVPTHAPEEEVIFSDFMAKLDKGDIEKVIIKSNHVSAVLKDKTRIRTFTAEYPDFVKVLREKGVQIEAKPPDESPWYITFLVTWGPFVLFLGLWFFLMRQMQIGGNKALSFGKSRARMLTEERKKVTFSDVAGIDEAKEEVLEIIEFLKDPRKFQKLGGRIPKGVLIVGPPGTGKTLLAKAIAGEAGVPFFSISGSDFVEMFVGVGASRVRDLFEQGKKHAPCIIFIDEIDAVGRLRGAGLGGGHDEREQTLNQLLVEMDGFDTTEGVILIAATNRPDVLDPALLRPGRFDRQVVVNRPDLRGRSEILKVHTKKVPIAANVELEKIARGTPGFSGADLENLVNEAALWAARQNKKEVEVIDFEMAKDKVLMGAERKSMILTDEEKRTTAYHEAGHALMAKLLPGTDPSRRHETILVTSHYDHLGVQKGKLYPGANDNASGVAAMLEVARLVVQQPLPRSVLFVAFGSEEQLMLGSYHYVAHPLRPLETTAAVLNLDMIGRNEEHTAESEGAYEVTAGTSDRLNLVGAVFSPDLEKVLTSEAPSAGLELSTKFDRDSSMRALFRCDHLPFLQKGVPAVWLFGGFHPGYHEPSDTVDRLDFDKLARVVRLTVSTVRALAASSAAKPRFDPK